MWWLRCRRRRAPTRWRGIAGRRTRLRRVWSGSGGTTPRKFLDSFYFQYGHASIADLGHTIFCFEGISELAAIEIEDEQLWDGQAKSSRYQDFSKGNVVVPPELLGTAGEQQYRAASDKLLEAYLEIHKRLVGHLTEKHPASRGDEGGRVQAHDRGAGL